MKVKSTQSRERVKGQCPLQGAGTASLLGSRGKAPAEYEAEPHSAIADKVQI